MRIGSFHFGFFARKDNSTLDLFRQLYGESLSYGGQAVTLESALHCAASLACGRVISQTLAQVPLKLYRQASDGGAITIAYDHPYYELLNLIPTIEQTSFEWRETIGLHIAFMGNAFCFKSRVDGVRIGELPIFDPRYVQIERDSAGFIKEYTVTAPSGSRMTFPPEAIWHIKGPAWLNWQGLKGIDIARNAIGLSISIEKSQADFFANGVKPSGVFSLDGILTPKQYTEWQEWFKKEHVGAARTGAPMILDRKAKWLQTMMTGVDAQTLESRRYQVEEVARSFGVLPIMIGYSDKTATYASAEQMFLAHVVHTASPLYVRVEQSISKNILSERDRSKGFYPKFVSEALLRGAMKDTADYLCKLTAGGIMLRNEARAKIELNPVDGLDEPLTPANTVPGTSQTPDPNAGDTSKGDQSNA